VFGNCRGNVMKNQLKTILLISVLSVLVLGVGALVAPSHLYLFIAMALVMNIGAYYFSDKLVLRMHGARAISSSEAPELHAMVAELSSRAGIPTPRIYLIPDRQPNAFATGRNPEHGVVAVTEGILEMLTFRELRGVIAHEIAHIKNRDILLSSIAAVLVSVITGIAHALSLATLFGAQNNQDEREEAGSGGVLIALVAPLAATLVQLGISRSREYLADEVGARLCEDPAALASALAKLERSSQLIESDSPQPATASLFIVNPLHGAGALLRLFSTHPSTEERVSRLLAMAQSGLERERDRFDLPYLRSILG
jgi:heat shock protein HtpX